MVFFLPSCFMHDAFTCCVDNQQSVADITANDDDDTEIEDGEVVGPQPSPALYVCCSSY